MKIKELLDRGILKQITFIEILKGMALTFRKMVSKAVTIQYPDQRRDIAPVDDAPVLFHDEGAMGLEDVRLWYPRS